MSAAWVCDVMISELYETASVNLVVNLSTQFTKSFDTPQPETPQSFSEYTISRSEKAERLE